MELAVVELLNFRVYTVVPNVSWGLGLGHECDLLAMDQNQKFTEIEIKTSKADLKRDFDKPHGHRSKYITRLVFAVPEALVADAAKLIPDDAGLICVYWHQSGAARYKARWVIKKRHKQAPPVPDRFCLKFMALGCMRIWTLKQKLFKHRP